MEIYKEHFATFPDNPRRFFLATVDTVEIEISTFCNRRCSFCPNSLADRFNRQEKMDDRLFSSIINQLSTINYDKRLSFHRYNEPLADRGYLISRLQEARRALPKSLLRIFTNGDYLTPDYLADIYAAGCRWIKCSVYIGDNSPYDDGAMIAAINKRIEKLNLPPTWRIVKPGEFEVNLKYLDMDLSLHGQNFMRIADNLSIKAGSDRGGALDFKQNIRREAPCMKPFREMQIEHDGTLFACCELRSDILVHQSSILGKLGPEDDIFKTWTNANYAAWREHLFRFGPKNGPCVTCTGYGMDGSLANRERMAKSRQELELT